MWALRFLAVLVTAFASGCWTIRETDHPVIEVAALPAGREPHVQVAGFEATVTSYDVAYGYATVTGCSGPIIWIEILIRRFAGWRWRKRRI